MGDATGTTEFPGLERCVEFIRSRNGAVMEDGFWWLAPVAGEHTERLIELVRTTDDPYVRGMFVELLGATHHARALPVLVAELDHPDPQVRDWAASALEELGLPEAQEHAARYFAARDSAER
jgi:HEAT repeat protein